VGISYCPVKRRQLLEQENILDNYIGQIMEAEIAITYNNSPLPFNIFIEIEPWLSIVGTQTIFQTQLWFLPFYRSLGQDLLSYIVDIIVPSITTRSEFNESDFRNLLEWCDIWIIVHTTTGIKYSIYVLPRVPKKTIPCLISFNVMST
jgi:hypothetical protein